MSRICEPIKWLFKEITSQFQFLDFTWNQKVLLEPCGLYYLIAILFCNAHTILHYPQIPQYFGCEPPSLDKYFHGGPIAEDELYDWAMSSLWRTCNVEGTDQDLDSGVIDLSSDNKPLDLYNKEME